MERNQQWRLTGFKDHRSHRDSPELRRQRGFTDSDCRPPATTGVYHCKPGLCRSLGSSCASNLYLHAHYHIHAHTRSEPNAYEFSHPYSHENRNSNRNRHLHPYLDTYLDVYPDAYPDKHPNSRYGSSIQRVYAKSAAAPVARRAVRRPLDEGRIITHGALWLRNCQRVSLG